MKVETKRPLIVKTNSAKIEVRSTDSAPTCDSLLQECVTVVEKQKKAIEEQQKTIQLMEEKSVQDRTELHEEQKSGNLWRGIAIGEAAAILILKLFGI